MVKKNVLARATGFFPDLIFLDGLVLDGIFLFIIGSVCKLFRSC